MFTIPSLYSVIIQMSDITRYSLQVFNEDKFSLIFMISMFSSDKSPNMKVFMCYICFLHALFSHLFLGGYNPRTQYVI